MEEQEAGSEARGWDRRKKGVCHGVMVCLSGSELKMDAAASVQTALRISLALSPLV